MRCNVCKDRVTVPYFNIPFHHTDVICGCCAMDSTIMGKYAPYTLNNHKRSELFLCWYINSIFKIWPDLNIEVSMDKVVTSQDKKQYKPDMLMVMSKDGSNNICAINLELDNHRQKTPAYILKKEKVIREWFFNQYMDKSHVCIISLNAMIGMNPNVGGNFEIFRAMSYVLDKAFHACVDVLNLPPEANRKTHRGLVLFNYSFGVESIFNFKLAMNRYMLNRLQKLLLNGEVRDNEWVEVLGNEVKAFPPIPKATEQCVYSRFREMTNYLHSQADFLNRMVLLSKGTGNVILAKLLNTTIDQVLLMPVDDVVNVKEVLSNVPTYGVSVAKIRHGRKAFDKFYNVLYNRSKMLKKLDELRDDNADGNVYVDSDDDEEDWRELPIQTLHDMEISLGSKMKFIRLTNY